MTLSELSIHRPVLAIVMNLVVILLGLICYQRLALREYPNVDPPVVTVATTYPGANATVIESQITTPIEEVLSGIEGVDFIQSISRAESSQISVRFRLDRDPDGAASDVRDRVARVQATLPRDVLAPTVSKVEADAQPIIYLAFSSDRHSELEVTDVAERQVKDRLQTVPGVAEVNVFAGRRFSMRIWLDPVKLAAFSITTSDVENALRRQNVEIAAGRIESKEREFTVRANTDLRSPEEFSAIILHNQPGYLVRLGDIARIELGPEDVRSIARFNGKKAVALGVVKQSTANPLDVAERIRESLPEVSRLVPEGMKIDVGYDSTIFISASIDSVFETIAEAIILVVLVIFLFLRSFRATLIPLVTIPVSLIGAFSLMYLFGFSINVLTLLAMVLAIGLVVDDAIVMLENIYRHIEAGMPPFKASLKGAREIAFAIIAMTLTLAAVYVPLAFSSGTTGRLFIEFALALAGAVIVSGFVALTLSPIMCSRLLKHSANHGKFYELGEQILNGMTTLYQRLLERAIRLRWFMLGLAMAIGVVGVFAVYKLPQELSPPEDRGLVIAFATAPEGASVEYTNRYAQQIQDIFPGLPETDRYFQIVGFPRINNALTFVRFTDWDKRTRSAQQIAKSLFGPFFSIAGVMAFPVTPPSIGQGGFGQPVQFVIQSTESYEELQKIVSHILDKMRQNPNLQSPDSDLKLNKPELSLNMNRDKIALVGANVGDVGETLQTLLGSRQVTRFKRGSDQYNVLVQVENQDRTTPEQLSLIYVRGQNNSMVPLSNLIDVQETVAPRELNHFNRLRAATISANLGANYSLGQALDFMVQTVKEVGGERVTYDYSGQSREFRDSTSDQLIVFILALVFIYLVLSAQFESFIDPLIILFSVPLAICGALCTLWLLHTGNVMGWWTGNGSLNIYSKIGLVTLIGLISKHGILIVEFSNQLASQGKNLKEAVIEAATLRLRPILMTTGAMVLGAIPLAFASGAGAESRVQIGAVIVGGMSFGTLMTLFVIPCVYTFLASRRHINAAEHERMTFVEAKI